MILRSNPASPFGRKVKITADILGLMSQITVVAADTLDANDPLRNDNPLGKIPALVLDDGSSLYDSRVIVEYLDHLAGGNKIIPQEPNQRFAALRLQALSDGIAEAAVLIIYESRYRDADKRVEAWVTHQQGKIDRGVAALAANLPEFSSHIPDIGQIAMACALGYLDLRFAGSWRKSHPRLVEWLDNFAAHYPIFEKTKMPA
jgi:glutathione S-transferase